MKTMILLFVLLASFSLNAQQTQQPQLPVEFTEGHTIANVPNLLLSTDGQGHFVIYNPKTLEFIAFDLKYLNHISEIEIKLASEATTNGEDYIYYFAKSVGGGLLALGQESLYRLAQPGLPFGIIFKNPNTLGTKIFYNNAHKLEQVTKEKLEMQSRPLPVEIQRIPEEYRAAIIEVSRFAFLYNIGRTQKSVNAR